MYETMRLLGACDSVLLGLRLLARQDVKIHNTIFKDLYHCDVRIRLLRDDVLKLLKHSEMRFWVG